MKRGRLFYVTGVSGAGKTTLAQALATRHAATFIDADDLHPAANITAMRAGRALDDQMRHGWLNTVARAAVEAAGLGSVFIACSALKRGYRDQLRAHSAPCEFVVLVADMALIQQRVDARHDHFMPTNLVASQFKDFEAATGENDVVTFAADMPLEELIKRVNVSLNLGT